MQSVEMFQKMFEYHYALLDRVWRSTESLSDEQYHQDLPYSRGSLHNQLFHVVATDRVWLRGLHELSRKPRLDPKATPDRDTLRQLYNQVQSDVLVFIDALTPTELERKPKRMHGPVWQVLLHMINHGTDHRAQILNALHQFGAPTFDQDLILWLWRR